MKHLFTAPVALLLFCLAFTFGLSQFSEYESAQSLVSTLLSGAITDGHPVNILYFASHFLLADVYAWLYSVTSGIPWYEIFMFGYTAISLFVILYLLWRTNANASVYFKLALTVLTLIVSTEFLFYMESTRVAFMLGTAATLLLFSSFRSKLAICISVLLFTVCLLTRPEVGVFILFFQWLGYLFYSSKRTALRFLLLHSLAVLLVMGYITYDRVTTTDYIKQFEPELGYQLLDRGNIVPLSTMKNEVDSVKYMAVTNMITDSAYTSISFLRSLVGNDPYTGVSIELIQRSLRIFTQSLNNALGFFIIYLAVLGLLLWQKFTTQPRIALLWIGYHLVFWGVIVVTIYAIKMESWVFSSAIALMLFIMFTQLTPVETTKAKLVAGLSVPVLVLGMVILFKRQHEYSTILSTQTNTSAAFTATLAIKAKDKVILPGINEALYLTHAFRPYQMPDYSAFKKIYLLDSDLLHMEKNYHTYLKNECQCNAGDYIALWDFVAGFKQDARLVMDSARTATIMNYCKVVRGRTYNLTTIDSLQTASTNSIIYRFE